MKVKTLVRELCKREGLKKQVDIAQVTELVGHLADLVYEELVEDQPTIIADLAELGRKRAKKKAKIK